MNKYLNIATILYVEDEEEICAQTLRALNRYTKKVYVARDGEEGLELYKKYKPDIVVTDIRMPKLNGIEMSKAIKAIDTNQAIIVISAHSDSSFFIDAIDLQLSGYILKPVNKNMLKNKILEIVKTQQLNKELQIKNEQLAELQRMSAMNELLGNIAHHWRQPLNVMATGVTSIQIRKEMDTLDDEFIDQTCSLVNENAQYLSKIIDDFSSYVNDEKVLKEFNLKKNIEDFLSLVTTLIDENKINIILDLEEDINIKSFPNELIQSFMNLFSNSKDALQNIEGNRYIFIQTYMQNDQVVICFKDNAGGVDLSIIDKIFQPYITTKHKSKGIGLSLNMTYDLITKSMGGTIKIENENFTYEQKEYTGAKAVIRLNKSTVGL